MNHRKTLQWILLLGTIGFTSYLLASDDEHGYYIPDRSLKPVSNAKWQEECGSCHMLYHPGLLPERSWSKLMGGLDKHFGENASLDSAARDEILRFLVTHSADHNPARRATRIAASIPTTATPLRFTETSYFVHKHDEIGASVWKRAKVGSKANCIACHPGAEKGDFAEDKVRIPR